MSESTEESREEGRKTVTINITVDGIDCVGDVTIEKSEDGGYIFDFRGLSTVTATDMNKMLYHDGRAYAHLHNILAWEALHVAGEGYDEDLVKCIETGFWADMGSMNWVSGREGYAFSNLTYYFDEEDSYCLESESTENKVRDSDGDIFYKKAPCGWFGGLPYCEDCGCYILDSDDYWDDYDGHYCCRWCHEKEDKVIEDYCESHRHNDSPVLFGKYKDEDSFVGLGFELEVDCDEYQSRNNNDTAKGLCEACGLEENEMRFAHDGSLNHGFECISQPHTVRDFWEKTEKWEKMLKYLLDAGYRSHDPGTCGLHVHVSRNMLGRTVEEQESAIAKIYSFFDNNWNDIARVSRRRSFDYCEKNELYSDDYDDISNGRSNTYECWKKKSKHSSGHHVALNNANAHTFEFRLGRGTLNPWSFFSWIDFVLTIAKNAKRITIGKVITNDRLSWLGGIKESTARYILSRNAFRKEMLALFPAIAWEQSSDDND